MNAQNPEKTEQLLDLLKRITASGSFESVKIADSISKLSKEIFDGEEQEAKYGSLGGKPRKPALSH